MSSDVKQRMLRGAVDLLGRSGLQATSFAEVIKATGAPRGSIYHHFPDGKDQMVAEALESLTETILQPLEKFAGCPPEKLTREYFKFWRAQFDEYPVSSCPVLAVLITAESKALREKAAAVFKAWREHTAALFEKGGLGKKQAYAFSTLLLASVEGAVALSRGDTAAEAFDVVESQMIAYAKTLRQ